MKSKVLVITDNGIQYERFQKLINDDFYRNYSFSFKRSHSSNIAKMYEGGIAELEEISVKLAHQNIADTYDLMISLHCKQIFPVELINKIKCINVHPGFNPINRGWYPQVFAINNETIIGATIHEIDEKLDHGNIIAREALPIYSWETSKEVYERILTLEMKLLEEHLPNILKNDYNSFAMEEEGKVYSRQDFQSLCEIDLNEKGDFKQFINRLRALTHGNYPNAYFYDQNDNKIFVSIALKKE